MLLAFRVIERGYLQSDENSLGGPGSSSKTAIASRSAVPKVRAMIFCRYLAVARADARFFSRKAAEYRLLPSLL